MITAILIPQLRLIWLINLFGFRKILKYQGLSVEYVDVVDTVEAW